MTCVFFFFARILIYKNKNVVYIKYGAFMIKNKKGFTLLELLVVVLIIGVLAAIALPRYQLAVDKARYSALMNITRAIADANERFYMVHDRYSTKFNELDIDIQANSIKGGDAYFDWGKCVLYKGWEVWCENDRSLKNHFIIFYVYSENEGYKNKTLCVAANTEENSRYDKVCQSVGKFDGKGSCTAGICRVYIIN